MHNRWLIPLLLAGSLVGPSLAHAAISNGANAIDALGQYDDGLTSLQPVYTKGSPNNGPSRFGLNLGSLPSGAAVDAVNHRLFVADSTNNRVLVFNLDSSNALLDHLPDNVLGQSNFYSNAAATTQTGLSAPASLALDSAGSRLFVADSGNNRVVVFSVSSISDGMSASNVLGQSGYTTMAAGTTQSGMTNPQGLAYDASGSRLFVSGKANNRVLVFPVSSVSDGMNASFVLGQPSFTASAAATSQAGLSSPLGLAYDPVRSRLFVADSGNNRVVSFSGSVIATGMNAGFVLGQGGFTTTTAATTQTGLKSPQGVSYDSTRGRLFVADTGNNRVVAFTGSVLANNMNAAFVLGQSSFTTSTAATTQPGLSAPRNVFFDTAASRLYVPQSGSHRVSIFSGATLATSVNASDLLGQYDDSLVSPQPAYTKSSADNGPNILGLGQPRGIALDTLHHRLFLVDRSNHRVLVYNLNGDNTLLDKIPDFVLGQPDFHSNAAATTQAGMHFPVGLSYDGVHDRLFVADSYNQRVLVFLLSSLSNGMNAAYVLGEPGFTTSTAATTQAGMGQATDVLYDSRANRLFVADLSNNRVLVFSGATLSNGMNANTVLGQSSFTTNTPAFTQAGMDLSGQNANGLALDSAGQRLFVSDTNHYRVLVFDTSFLSNGMNASFVLGQPNFTIRQQLVSQSTMICPEGLAYDAVNNRLFVADYWNFRVLVFNVASISNGMKAANVLGEPNFTTATSATTQSGVNNPAAVAYDAAHNLLYVAEASNSRLLLFDVAPSPATLSLNTPTLGGSITVTLTDAYRDTTTGIDTASVTLTDQDGDSEALTLRETGTGSGMFTASLPLAHPQVVSNDGALENAGQGSFTVTATYTDFYGSIVTATSVITDTVAAGGVGGGTRGGGGGGWRGGGRPPVGAVGFSRSSSPSSSLNSSSSSQHSVSSSRCLSTIPASFVTVQSDGNTRVLLCDVPLSSWFAPFVEDLVHRHIIEGYRDTQGRLRGLFGPGNPVTKAEVLKMALVAGNKDIDPVATPRNASAQHEWSAPYVAEAETLGLSLYTEDVDVRLPATRGQVIQTLLEVFGIPTDASGQNPFLDLPGDHPASPAIVTAWKRGWITGDTDSQGQPAGTVRPDDPINRAEVSALLDRILQSMEAPF